MMKNMSIRLRLTLIYSTILAVTLIIFNMLVFAAQVRFTFQETSDDLLQRAEVTAKMIKSPPREFRPPPPAQFDTYIQVRTLAGEILSPFTHTPVTLPLSEKGQVAVQQGESWVEAEVTEAGFYLIYSQPTLDQHGNTVILQVARSLEDRRKFLDTMRTILLLGSAVVVVIAFGVGWLVSGWALRPINQLTRTAQAIGSQRDFGQRVTPAGPNDEIGQLATTFNTMLGELQAAYLQKEQALQTQRRFVADASHELRTPLTTIRGNLGLLQREPPINPEDQVEIVADLVDETERLMRLVHDLLVLARADAQQALPLETLLLQPLLQEVCQQCQRLDPQRSIECQHRHVSTVWGNADALKQVLLILLDNALTHTPPETVISVTCTQQQAQVAIQVRDAGGGIPPEHLPHIFARFYRGDTARTSGGAGLGLAIAKDLIEAQGGLLTVASQLHQGTTFTILLPRNINDPLN